MKANMKKSDYKKRWCAVDCFNGPNYFGKLIKAENLHYKKGWVGWFDDFIIPYSNEDEKIDQSILAQHIVKLHNESLEGVKNEEK